MNNINNVNIIENVKLVKQYGKGLRALQLHYKEKQDKIKSYQKANALISFCPILNASCQCEPLSNERVPK